MTIKELQTWVKQDWEQRSATQPSLQQQLLYIMEELGEVAEAIRKMDGNKQRLQNDVGLGSEIADLIVSIVTPANTYNVDIDQQIEDFKQRLESRR